ncbi:MAG: hypothetical protein Q9214_000762 [Letrouitia sp. 1 TL-2023]
MATGLALSHRRSCLVQERRTFVPDNQERLEKPEVVICSRFGEYGVDAYQTCIDPQVDITMHANLSKLVSVYLPPTLGKLESRKYVAQTTRDAQNSGQADQPLSLVDGKPVKG